MSGNSSGGGTSSSTQNLGKLVTLKGTLNMVEYQEKEFPYVIKQQEKFGFLWTIFINQEDDGDTKILIECDNLYQDQDFQVETDIHVKLIGKRFHCLQRPKIFTGGAFGGKFDLDRLIGLVNDEIQIELTCQIIKTTILGRIPKTDFNQPELGDICFKVRDSEFHVSKLHLARQSEYFRALFFANFRESGQDEIKLDGIDPFDFQNFLDVLYLESIDELTVEGILHLADMYQDTKVKDLCENFLLQTSIKQLGKKLQLAKTYGMKKLEEDCLQKITVTLD